jgi:hypothetical protein
MPAPPAVAAPSDLEPAMDLQIDQFAPGRYSLSGDVGPPEGHAFVAFTKIAPLDASGGILLELADVDLSCGVACALAVDAVRVLLQRAN